MAAAEPVRSRLKGAVGRVESAGTFEDAEVERQLRCALAEPFAACTRPQMEWYGCRGAFFHNDAHFDGVLFGVWSIAGPPRELVFPRIGCRLPARVGSIVVFDPFEPHAVLDAGVTHYRRQDYEEADANLFLGFEVVLSAEVRTALGIGPAYELALTLSSRLAINPETGALARSAA